MSIFDIFQTDKVIVVKKDGSNPSPEVNAQVNRNVIHVELKKLPSGFDIEDGDYIDRIMPNNKLERYEVLDAGFRAEFDPIPAAYECKVKKINSPIQSSSQNITYNLHGSNSRVYNASSDNSTNSVTVGQQEVFTELRNLISSEIKTNSVQLFSLLDEMEAEKGKPTFTTAYAKFMSSAADHMTLLTPFLPALAKYFVQ